MLVLWRLDGRCGRRTSAEEQPLTDSPSHDPAESRRRIERGLAAHPYLIARVHRALLILLHGRGIVSVDTIHARARNQGAPPSPADVVENNVQVASQRNDQNKRRLQEIIWEEAAQAFTPAEIDDVLNRQVHGLHGN